VAVRSEDFSTSAAGGRIPFDQRELQRGFVLDGVSCGDDSPSNLTMSDCTQQPLTLA
jgi:hypothetical protein